MSLPIAREILKSKPIAYWPLQELSGTVAREIVGGRDGTYTGSPVLGAPGFPNIGKMVDFNGSSQYVTIPDDNVFSINNTNLFTVMGLCFADTLANNINTIVAKGGASGSGYEWQTYLGSDTFPAGVAYTSAGGAYMNGITAAYPSLKRLRLISMTIDAPNLGVLYSDGSRIGTQTSFPGIYTNGTGPLEIARRPDADKYFDGRISHVSIWNRVLAGAEVLAIRRALLGPLNRRGRFAA